MALSTSQFFATFMSAVMLFDPEEMDPSLRTPNTPQSEVAQAYDFIIVGGGSAGCVLANRLTENPEWNVLLVEAGGEDNYISDTPYLTAFLTGTSFDWNYTTVRQEHACLSEEGYCALPQGKVIGGSSTLSDMFYVRGNRADYDEWMRLGNQGWGYEDVLPYFIRAENMTIPSLRNSPYHGTSGPFTVQYPRFVTPLRDDFISAGEELGWHYGDYNGADQTVIAYTQYNLNGALRENTVRAYLNPIRNRTNLHIILDSVVSKIIVENKVAKGIEYVRDNVSYRIYANKDVVVSAGTVGTPKLLMLSGIGPANELKRFNIEVVEDLPVGSNYVNHVVVPLYFQLSDTAPTVTPAVWRTNDSILEYVRYGEGPLTLAGLGCESISFFNPLERSLPPSVQTVYCTNTLVTPNLDENLHIILISVINVAPASVGYVTLASADFRDPPLIQQNIFGNPIDKIVVEKGIGKVLQFMSTNTMSRYAPQIHTGNLQPDCMGTSGNNYVQCIIANYSLPDSHLVGTARMGPRDRPDTVVSSEDLFVKGMTNLRVVDASLMPTVPRGNTGAPAIMVAERASDIIKNYYMNLVNNSSSS